MLNNKREAVLVSRSGNGWEILAYGSRGGLYGLSIIYKESEISTLRWDLGKLSPKLVRELARVVTDFSNRLTELDGEDKVPGN